MENKRVSNVLERTLFLVIALLALAGTAAAQPRLASQADAIGSEPDDYVLMPDGPHAPETEGDFPDEESIDQGQPASLIDPDVMPVEDVDPVVEPSPGGTSELQMPVVPESVPAPALEPEPLQADPADWDEDYWQQNYEPPAPTCTSGTWFNRGKWYARQDFVYMSRFTMDTRQLVADYTDTNANGIPFEQSTTGRSLGFEPGAKFTLGRFLYRDGKNRDHSLEFTFTGLFDWQQSNGMTARSTNALFTLLDPYRLTAAQVGGFNQAQTQNWNYDSSFDSYEFNYVIGHRLARDRLEMTPQGEWVRNLNPGHTSTVLAGIRYINVNEGFKWTSVGSNPATRNGLYDVTTTNHMVGVHFGHELTFQRPKFRVGIRNKAGVFTNYADQNSFVHIVDTTSPADRIETGNSHDLSFVYDLNIMAAYHLRPNLAIRFGYDFMFVNQLALAPEQLTFVPPPADRIVTGGVLLYNGFSSGIEFVW